MIYTTTLLNRQTGELNSVCLGEYLTVTELAKLYNVGPRQFRRVLDRMGLFQQVGTSGRRLLHPDAIDAGFGRTNWGTDKQGNQRPFDVISPLGQAHIADRWDATVQELSRNTASDLMAACGALHAFESTRLKPFPLDQKIGWLFDHFPRLTQSAISQCLNADAGYVSRIAKARTQSRAATREAILELTGGKPNLLMRDLAQRQGFDLTG